MIRATVLPAVLLLVAILGCGPENKLGRKAIEGSINLDGQPLDQGSIMFAPKQSGPSSGAEIENGGFAIPAHQGLTPGSYVVRIYSADSGSQPVEPVLPGPGLKTQPERIPLKYNMKSKYELVVGEDDDVAKFDLDIETK